MPEDQQQPTITAAPELAISGTAQVVEQLLNEGTRPKSFSFIISQAEIQAKLPIEVIPNHFLQRANPEQISTIKQRLGQFGASSWHEGLYECAYHKGAEGGKTTLTAVRLPEDQWRYWVVAFDAKTQGMEDLEIAAALLVNDLRFGFAIDYVPLKGRFVEGFKWDPEFMGEYSSNFAWLFQPPTVITETDILYLRKYHQNLQSVKSSHVGLYKAAQRFHLLRRLPRSSVFNVIGYFSVIEALITHAPALTEPMDSLTHQMKTKMNLLAKRFQRPLNYSGFFKSTEGDKIWGKLYGYRSKLAHGDEADFINDFKILNSPENALQFLNEAAKVLILYAMAEPEFILDLKKC